MKQNEDLQGFATELRDAFINIIKSSEGKSVLKNEFDTKGTRFSSTGLDVIVQELKELSASREFTEKIGPKNAKEFTEKIDNLAKEYEQAPLDKKVSTLHKNLESLKEWSQTKEKESKNSTISKIGTVISSYAKAVGSWINGNNKAYEENKLNASQAIKELKQSKSVSEGLSSTTLKTQSWTQKINEEKNTRNQTQGKSR